MSLIQTPATNRIFKFKIQQKTSTFKLSCYLSSKQTPTTTYRLFCPTPSLRLSTNLSTPKTVSPSLCFRRIPKRKWKWKTLIPNQAPSLCHYRSWHCTLKSKENRIFNSYQIKKVKILKFKHFSSRVTQFWNLQCEVCFRRNPLKKMNDATTNPSI